jgi:CRP/FNR family transcriptional regulator
MFSFLARNMAQDHQRMADMAGAEGEVRLARTLCMLTDKFGTTVSVKRRELAGLAATSVETTIRFLSKMKKEGIVGSGRMGEILILDLERLRERGSAKLPMSLRDDARRSYMPVAK